LSAPDREPAMTVSSELLNLTASTGDVWPDRLCADTDADNAAQIHTTLIRVTAIKLCRYYLQ